MKNSNVRYVDCFDFEQSEMSKISEKCYKKDDLVHLTTDAYIDVTDMLLAYYIQEFGANTSLDVQGESETELSQEFIDAYLQSPASDEQV